MAILKAKKIREMQESELRERVQEMRTELLKERASAEVGGTVKNPGRISELRRTVARIKTIQAQKENAAKGK